jgi:hypothetical protein
MKDHSRERHDHSKHVHKKMIRKAVTIRKISYKIHHTTTMPGILMAAMTNTPDTTLPISGGVL